MSTYKQLSYQEIVEVMSKNSEATLKSQKWKKTEALIKIRIATNQKHMRNAQVN